MTISSQTEEITSAKQDQELSKSDIKAIFYELKYKELHPSGNFDNAGRWFAENDHLINVRTPSRSYPFSQLTACRSLKYVNRVAESFNCTSIEELRASV